MSVRTNLARELREQARWRPRRATFRADDAFRLARNEFQTSDALNGTALKQLQYQLSFCAAHVPFYRSLTQITSLAELTRLSTISKATVRDYAEALMARYLPDHEQPAGVMKTSGTTGQPLTIHHSARSLGLLRALTQRSYRWFRINPQRRFAAIQPPSDLPRRPDGARLQVGETCELAAWPLVGREYVTGDYRAINHRASPNTQVDWLHAQRPGYLRTQAANLEQIAFTAGGRASPAPGIPGLEGAIAISQQLTPQMETLIEKALQIPVYLTYGLNEFGLVAVRCSSGRYHVFPENVWVEIVDDDDHPVKDGELGRLVVTSLSNFAMPLLRYDTEDVARRMDSPCECGRTLPSFTDIQGRYRRLIHLPPGTWMHWMVTQGAISRMPPELLAPLRQFQLHQFDDTSFELRLARSAPLAPRFFERLRDAWAEADETVHMALRIVEMEEIPTDGYGKFQSFTSAYFDGGDESTAAPPNGEAQPRRTD